MKWMLDLRCSRAICAAGLFALVCSSTVALAAEPKLLPAPREVHWTGEALLPSTVAIVVPGHDRDDEFAAADLADALKLGGRTIAAGAQFRVELLRAASVEGKAALSALNAKIDAPMKDEGYVLAVDAKHAVIVAETASGVFYGVQTLKQMLPLAGEQASIATGSVRDWPAMKYRGVDDDLSRGPFPTLEFQKKQIRVFASFKANIYSPYLEHTLYYANQPLAAPPGSYLSPADVAELVRYAAQYHITVVPEQEAFGHLHQVLKYDIYQDVAETPHGHVLAPGQPGSMPLIKDWFKQIAEQFPSPFVHIGADETLDLGRGRTHDEVAKRGYGPVYVDFLKQIHDGLAPLNKKILFWGDISWDDPKAIPGLPKDMIAVPWNYWDTTGFDKVLVPFQQAGMETWVAPGDDNWNEVYPKAKIAFGNIQGFIRDGQKYGSTGALNTVWNDDGEGLFNEDWYTVLFGPVAAWQPGESSIENYQNAFGRVFHGDQTGKINEALKEVMASFAALDKAKYTYDSDSLFWVDPWSSQGRDLSVKILPVAKELREHAERALVLVAQARAEHPDLKEQDALTALDLGARRLDLIGLKFEVADEIAATYQQAVAQQHDKTRANDTRNILEQISSMFGRCQDLRDGYSAIKDEYSQIWASENRPYWLGNVTVRYDLAIQNWQQRSIRFQGAIYDWENGKELPSPTALGLPEAK